MKIQKRQEIEFFGTKTGNANSIALGYATETKNFGEVAVGVMNKSTAAKDPNSPKGVCVDSDATLFSVGCGGSGERKNALEVKGDGSVLISGENGDINVADKIKQALDTDASIELVKSAESDLQYTLMVNNESRGSINIPKDQFLKNVTYDTEAKQLVFTFVTLDEEEHVERISINDLKDVYTAGDGINIDNNVISADFSSVMTAISDEKTQRETTDNEIKSTLDNAVQRITYNKKTNPDDITHTNITRAIDTPLIVGGKNNSNSTNTGLVLQDSNSSFEDGTGSFIKLSPNNVDINAEGSIHLNSNVRIGSAYDTYENSIYFDRAGGAGHGKTVINTGTLYINNKNMCSEPILEIYGGASPNYKYRSDNGYSFKCISPDCEFTIGYDTDGIKISNQNTINYLFNSTDSRLAKDMIQAHREFAEDGVTVDATKSVIRFRIDSNNSAKLTQAKGFQVFTDLYADPEHCKDINDYTDSEKAILTNNTVQKNILDLNKNKADVSALPTKLSDLENDAVDITINKGEKSKRPLRIMCKDDNDIYRSILKYNLPNENTGIGSLVFTSFDENGGYLSQINMRASGDNNDGYYLIQVQDVTNKKLHTVTTMAPGSFHNLNYDNATLSTLTSQDLSFYTDRFSTTAKQLQLVVNKDGITKKDGKATEVFAANGTLFDLDTKADTSAIPTKVSQLTNDANFITSYAETDPVWTSEKGNYYTKTEIDGKGYLTAHQPLDAYAKKSEIPNVSTKADLIDGKLKSEQLPKLDNIAAATTTEDMITKFNALLTDLKAKGYMTADITA